MNWTPENRAFGLRILCALLALVALGLAGYADAADWPTEVIGGLTMIFGYLIGWVRQGPGYVDAIQAPERKD